MGKFSVRKTQEEFVNEVYNLAGDQYTVIGTYMRANVKVDIRHNVCGTTYAVKPNHFLSGSRCPKCSGLERKTQSWFENKVKELTGDEYKVVGKYVNMGTKVSLLHNVCGKVYSVTPTHFIYSGSRCSHCSKVHHYTDDEFTSEVQKLVGDEYTFLKPYIDSRTKLPVIHNACGGEYEVKPNDFFTGKRCPYCNSPHGELFIKSWLSKNSIEFEYQKKFPSLKDSKPLSYDFYISGKKILIEYQGGQHFWSVDYFGGEEGFKRQKEHDKIKANYASSIGCMLLCPSYKLDSYEKVADYLDTHII